MHVISQKPLRDFAKAHPNAAAPLGAWLKLVRHGHFENPAELQRTFGTVDMVPVKGRNLYVFNVGGNNFRLIAAIHFNTQRLFIRYVLTHGEYDLGRWKR